MRELFNHKPVDRPAVAGRRFADHEDGGAFIERFYEVASASSAAGFKMHYAHCRTSKAVARAWRQVEDVSEALVPASRDGFGVAREA